MVFLWFSRAFSRIFLLGFPGDFLFLAFLFQGLLGMIFYWVFKKIQVGRWKRRGVGGEWFLDVFRFFFCQGFWGFVGFF